MSTCQMCGTEIENGEYCESCADYLRQSYEQMERDAAWHEEMKRDAFGEFRY